MLDASEANPAIVKLSVQDKKLVWNKTLTLLRIEPNEIAIPLPSDSNVLSITIEVIGATSPQKLGINKNDERILGMYLNSVNLREE
ncbi:hypothetical protein [Yersinia alsatica]|uniref:hypothetical protein n=1 Tax=Yersinia alsatica TaxID=2890317 RepID=UPI0011A043B7|nr:hypothetical protein [Yersinia alsatica]